MARSPRGDGPDWRRRGNRDPRPSLLPARAASAQLVIDSSAGPHRSIASPGVATLVLLQVDLVIIRPVTGPGANQNVTGSGVCRKATSEVGPHVVCRRKRGRRVAPVRLAAPRAGPVVAVCFGAGLCRPRNTPPVVSTHQVPFICLLPWLAGSTDQVPLMCLLHRLSPVASLCRR